MSIQSVEKAVANLYQRLEPVMHPPNPPSQSGGNGSAREGGPRSPSVCIILEMSQKVSDLALCVNTINSRLDC